MQLPNVGENMDFKRRVPQTEMVNQPFFHQVPRFKRALSRVIEYECHYPGQFAKWLEDLHIEHWRAGFSKDKPQNDPSN
jgi:hypothetical protein